MTTICQAAQAEKIIRDTGLLIGGTFVISRDIEATGAVEIRDCAFVRADPEQMLDALRKIDLIVHTPTKKTKHDSAGDHFQSDFDAIRRLTAPWRH